MKFLLLLSILLGIMNSAFAISEYDLHLGDQLAQELLRQMETHKKKAGEHPFYQGIPPESSSNLERKAENMVHESPAGEWVRKSASTRSQFKVAPERDPLIMGAEKIMKDPLKIIGGERTRTVHQTQGGKDEILTCEESGEEALYTCVSPLHVEVREELGEPQQETMTFPGGAYGSLAGILTWPRVCPRHFVAYMISDQNAIRVFVSHNKGIPLERILSASGTQSDGWHKIRHKHYVCGNYHITYTYRPLIKVPHFSWIDGCVALEARADEGQCTYVSKDCTQGPGTRVIDGVSITRDCWEYTYTYSCGHSSKNNCGPLRVRGCVQIKSDCKKRSGGACLVYTQTYQCKGDSRNITHIAGGDTPFCLDGHCRDQSFEPNDELMSSMAQLSLLKEMQGKFDGLLFKGQDDRCSKATLSFKDCCGSGKGWGVSLGLAGCSAEEKALQLKRQKGLCHFVGTYCSKREQITKICLQKKTSYCCFGSKLLRIFHEQGRSQIGMNWGPSDSPTCRGFMVEELQRIDFSKLDLREVFEEIMKSYSPQKLESINQKLKDRLKTLKDRGSPKKGCPLKQRPEA